MRHRSFTSAELGILKWSGPATAQLCLPHLNPNTIKIDRSTICIMTPKSPTPYKEDQIQETITNILRCRGVRRTAWRLGIPRGNIRGRLRGHESKRLGHEIQQKLSSDQ